MRLIEDVFMAVMKIAWNLTVGVIKYFLKGIFPGVDWDSGTGACLIVLIFFGTIALCNLSTYLLRLIIS